MNQATVSNRRIADFCTTGTGSTPSRAANGRFFGGTILWVKSGELAENVITCTEECVTAEGMTGARLKMVPAGAVLVALYGATVGKTAMLGINATTNQAVCHIVPEPSVADVQYVWYALRAKLPEFLAKRTGGAQQNISQGLIRETEILLPALAEQKRIAAILDKADGILQRRKQGVCLTAELLRSTFLEMFGDPAKNRRRWPLRPMGGVIKETQYGTSDKSNSDGVGIPVLRMNNITYGGDFDLIDIKWSEISDADLPKFTVRRGDLLFNRTNSPELVGKTAVWDRDESYAYAGYLFRVRFDEQLVLPDYVSAFLNSDFGKKMLFAKAKPSNNMSNFSAGEFRRIEMPVPDIDLQRRFAAAVAQIKAVKRTRLAAAAESARLFASLVHLAFRGEL